MKFDAVIFDLDGVLCSTDRYHYSAWKAIADELGVPFDERVNNRLRGVSRMESLDIVLETYGGSLSQSEKETLAERKNASYRAMLGEMTPADVTGETRDVLAALRTSGLKLAVGSSSKNARYILERTGLTGCFDAVSDGVGLTRSKPDPEVFLRAAALLGVCPEKCAIVEDAVAGVQAGRAAGMFTFAMGDAAQADLADHNLASFSELLLHCECTNS